jgi:hypothetical protein
MATPRARQKIRVIYATKSRAFSTAPLRKRALNLRKFFSSLA